MKSDGLYCDAKRCWNKMRNAECCVASDAVVVPLVCVYFPEYSLCPFRGEVSVFETVEQGL